MSKERAASALIDSNLVAFGGGLINGSIDERLSSVGVKLHNHYGATEIGPIAPILIPSKDYDCRFLKMRKNMDLESSVFPASIDRRPWYRMTALPFGRTEETVVQDELLCDPQHPYLDFSAIGRNDDMIVLATGANVTPHVPESSLSEAGDVRAVIAFGDGHLELGVIVGPQYLINLKDRRIFVSSLWPLIVEINKCLDGHAQLQAQTAVVILSLEKSLPRSDKGSVMRKEAYRGFKEEIPPFET